MGRKAQPTQLKVVRGNPGKRPLNDSEPQLDITIPDAPDFLSDTAKEHWSDIVIHLHDARIMTALDADALSLYCEAYSRWVEANEKIKLHGMVVKSPSGYPMQTPYLSVSNKAFDQMKSIMVEFGMTPSSRSKIQVSKPEATNPFDNV